MRLVTFRADDGAPHVGVIRDEEIIDLTLWLPQQEPVYLSDFTMVELIAAEPEVWQQVVAALEASEAAVKGANALVPLEPGRLMAPIPRPLKNVLCMGRNYAEHAKESARAFGGVLGQPPSAPTKPPHPAIFTKAPTSVIGPFDDIPYDAALTESLDWEVELAVVIGRKGKNIPESQAMEYVFGYTVLNDVSARDIQSRHGNQFFKGKSLDGTCPIGPWIVTVDEVPDPNNLSLSLHVNGVEKQQDTTASMLWNVQQIIQIMSHGMTLEPGDIIATGTPAGVGFARQPAEFLQPGDLVECEVETIGKISNRVRKID